jgi:hypothetical protein
MLTTHLLQTKKKNKRIKNKRIGARIPEISLSLRLIFYLDFVFLPVIVFGAPPAGSHADETAPQ